MKIQNTIEEVRSDSKNINTQINGVTAFIVLIPYSKTKAFYGINFLLPDTDLGTTYKNSEGWYDITVIEKL